MAYSGVDWQNKPSTASPINRTNLEIMDNGIVSADANATAAKTEVENVRVGEDGVTYSSAGNAVRSQFSNLKNNIKNTTLNIIRNTGYTTSNVVAPYNDLNTFPENEMAYYTNGNVAANSPTTEAFQIICYRAYNIASRPNQNKIQMVITVSSKVYMRTCATTSSTWTAWIEPLTNQDYPKLIILDRNNGYTSSNVVAPYDNLNTFPENEVAYYTNGNVAQNSPTASAFQIICIRTYNNANRPNMGKAQIVITEGNKIYFRSNVTASQVWTNWTEVLNSGDAIQTNFAVIQSSNITAPYDNLNTLPNNSYIYYLQNSGVLNSPVPASYQFSVLTLNGYKSVNAPMRGKIQIVIPTIEMPEIYIRLSYDNAGTWTKWWGIETKNLDSVSHVYRDYFRQKYSVDSSSKLLFSGDSITYGVTSDASGDHSNGYVYLIQRALNCSIENFGVSGASYYLHSGTNTSILQQLQTAVSQGKLVGDYLFVFAGTNDYGLGTTMANFEAALDETFNYIDANYNGIVTIILPIGRSEIPTHAILPLDNYTEKIFEKAIAHEYNIMNGMEFGFPVDNSSPSYVQAVLKDGTHPTKLGHRVLANTILNYITTLYVN